MIKMLSRTAALFASTATVIFAVAMPAFSQAPTDAQRSAIRSECRSDYEAHCASIPPGGAASLQCLQKNISSLSASCQTAVRAVEAPATPKAESAPAAPKAATTPPAATAKPATETAANSTDTAKANAEKAAMRQELERHNRLYYLEGAPEISRLPELEVWDPPWHCWQVLPSPGEPV